MSDKQNNNTLQGFITIAIGSTYYKKLALNLAKSFEFSNSNNLTLTIVTDDLDFFNQRPLNNILLKKVFPGELPTGYAAKLYLNTLSDYVESIFIDCDCLIYKDISGLFEYFRKSRQSFGVIGTNPKSGDFFCEIAAIRKKFNLDYLPKFVGSLYYFKKCNEVDEIFNLAKKLVDDYDDIGFIRLANKVNEEPLIAIGLAKFNIKAITDDGSIKADMMFYNHIRCNILFNKANLWNTTEIPVPEYSILIQANPLIVHFNSSFSEGLIYNTEVSRLLLFKRFHSRIISNGISFLLSELPYLTIKYIKFALRPLHRCFFGYRKVKKSKRG